MKIHQITVGPNVGTFRVEIQGEVVSQPMTGHEVIREIAVRYSTELDLEFSEGFDPMSKVIFNSAILGMSCLSVAILTKKLLSETNSA